MKGSELKSKSAIEHIDEVMRAAYSEYANLPQEIYFNIPPQVAVKVPIMREFAHKEDEHGLLWIYGLMYRGFGDDAQPTVEDWVFTHPDEEMPMLFAFALLSASGHRETRVPIGERIHQLVDNEFDSFVKKCMSEVLHSRGGDVAAALMMLPDDTLKRFPDKEMDTLMWYLSTGVSYYWTQHEGIVTALKRRLNYIGY
jgi:hypothetical protein